MIIIPSAAATYTLDSFLADLAPYYHLFTNDFTPDAATTLASFDEPTWPGYLALLARRWSPSLWDGMAAVSSADPLIWTLTAAIVPVQVYGYFVTDGQPGPLIWCELREDGPITMEHSGDQVPVLPELRGCGGCSPG